MRRHASDGGLIPKGFEITAHNCFKEYHYPPVSLIQVLDLQDILRPKLKIDDNDLELKGCTNTDSDENTLEPKHIIDDNTHKNNDNDVTNIDLIINTASDSIINNDDKIILPLNNNDLDHMKKRLSKTRKEKLLACNENNNIEKSKEEIEKKDTKNHDNIDVCSICLETFKNPATLLQCNHSFCSDCIVYWMISTSLCCPLCKTEGQCFITSTHGEKNDNKIKVCIFIKFYYN